MTMQDRAPLYAVGKCLFAVLFRLYNRWEVSGRRHMPAAGGALLIANHTSYADPPVVGTACPRPVNFMAKAELFTIPVLGAVISRTRAFPMRRGSGDRAALRRAVRLLREGNVLLIFPEGRRSPDGRVLPPEHGAAFIALASGAPVVPVGVDGADRLLPVHSPLIRPAKVRVRFGAPLDLSRWQGQRPTRECLEQVSEQMMAALRALLPPDRH